MLLLLLSGGYHCSHYGYCEMPKLILWESGFRNEEQLTVTIRGLSRQSPWLILESVCRNEGGETIVLCATCGLQRVVIRATKWAYKFWVEISLNDNNMLKHSILKAQWNTLVCGKVK